MKQRLLTTTLAACALLATGLTSSLAALSVRVSTDDGATWATAADGDTNDSEPAVGAVTLSTNTAGWIIIINSSSSKPIIGGPLEPRFACSGANLSTGPGKLIVQVSDTGFTTATAPREFASSFAGTLGASGWVSSRVMVDTNNVLFGVTGTSASASTILTHGPLMIPLGGFDDDTAALSSENGGSPFAVTIEFVFAHDAGQISSYGEDLRVPATMLLDCASGTGQVGVPYQSALIASGGVAPYTFSIVSGALPPGLQLEASTGIIFGTPTAAGTFSFRAAVVDSTGLTTGDHRAFVDCNITTTPPEESGLGCRTTGGGRQAASFPAVRYVTHGGQVGAPVGNETAFSPDSTCIQGNWEHVRHIKAGLRGNFHAKSFDSLMCACLGCPEDPFAPITIGGICNPDNTTCGPLPRKAPANKITFSGVGDYVLTQGNRTPRSVLFRVDLEDRGEPGNSSAGGAEAPNDRHRIRIWILTAQELAKLNNPADRLLGFRQAIAASNGLTLKDGATINGQPVPNGTAVFGVRAPDIDDGGDMTHGNHQIHPAIKPCAE